MRLCLGWLRDFGDARYPRASWCHTFWRIVELTVNIHHDKLQLVALRFNVGIRVKIKLHKQRPTILDIVNGLQDQGTPLKWRIVLF